MVACQKAREAYRAHQRGVSVTEIEVSLIEFAAYAKGLKHPNFSIGALDQYARKKAMAQAQEPAPFLKAG
jgi:hypothetical protein